LRTRRQFHNEPFTFPTVELHLTCAQSHRTRQPYSFPSSALG
jgi:hypothetical protein